MARKVEVFVAGCPVCEPAVKLVKEMACGNCEVTIYDLRESCATDECRTKAEQYGIKRLPAVAIDGQLADCCSTQQGITREALAAAGLGLSKV